MYDWVLSLLHLLELIPIIASKGRWLYSYAEGNRLHICFDKPPRDVVLQYIDVGGHYLPAGIIEAEGDVKKIGDALEVIRGGRAHLKIHWGRKASKIILYIPQGQLEVKVGKGGRCPVEESQSIAPMENPQ